MSDPLPQAAALIESAVGGPLEAPSGVSRSLPRIDRPPHPWSPHLLEAPRWAGCGMSLLLRLFLKR